MGTRFPRACRGAAPLPVPGCSPGGWLKASRLRGCEKGSPHCRTPQGRRDMLQQPQETRAKPLPPSGSRPPPIWVSCTSNCRQGRHPRGKPGGRDTAAAAQAQAGAGSRALHPFPATPDGCVHWCWRGAGSKEDTATSRARQRHTGRKAQLPPRAITVPHVTQTWALCHRPPWHR